MDIAATVNIIATVIAVVAAGYALKTKRGDFQSKMLSDCQKAYEHKCGETAEAWAQVDKKEAEIDVLRELLARKEAENAKLRERMARRKLDAENGNGA